MSRVNAHAGMARLQGLKPPCSVLSVWTGGGMTLVMLKPAFQVEALSTALSRHPLMLHWAKFLLEWLSDGFCLAEAHT